MNKMIKPLHVFCVNSALQISVLSLVNSLCSCVSDPPYNPLRHSHERRGFITTADPPDSLCYRSAPRPQQRARQRTLSAFARRTRSDPPRFLFFRHHQRFRRSADHVRSMLALRKRKFSLVPQPLRKRFGQQVRLHRSRRHRARRPRPRLRARPLQRAKAAGHTRIACEVNLDPPNPISDAFHASLNFSELGRASIYNGAKTVRYLLRDL